MAESCLRLRRGEKTVRELTGVKPKASKKSRKKTEIVATAVYGRNTRKQQLRKQPTGGQANLPGQRADRPLLCDAHGSAATGHDGVQQEGKFLERVRKQAPKEPAKNCIFWWRSENAEVIAAQVPHPNHHFRSQCSIIVGVSSMQPADGVESALPSKSPSATEESPMYWMNSYCHEEQRHHRKSVRLQNRSRRAQSAFSSKRGEHSARRLGRIDAVLNLVGELIIGKSMLQQALNELAKLHPREAIRGKFPMPWHFSREC